MKTHIPGILNFLLVLFACTATMIEPVRADELSELYLNSSNDNANSAIGPNILIILDTSGSMTRHGVDELGFTVDPQRYWNAPYDPDTSYPGPCDPTLAYRKSFNSDYDGDGDIDDDDVTDGDFQSCGNAFNFPLTAMACERVLEQGFAVDNFGEFRPKTLGPYENYTYNDIDGDGVGEVDLDGTWNNISSHFNEVADIGSAIVWRECASDYGTHGLDSTTSYKWPSDTETPFGWVQSPFLGDSLEPRSRQLVATGNYINYYRWSQTRLAAVQAALREVIAELPPETHLGVMRFDAKVEVPLDEGSSDGAYVVHEFVQLGENTLDSDGNVVLSTNRQALIDSVYAIDPADDGGTPLGESLFEALQVFRGGTVTFGADAEIWNIDTSVWPWDSNMTSYADVSSVAASRDPVNASEYATPILYECQKNAVIFLSDGDPQGDTNTDNHFDDLPNAASYGATGCDDDGRTTCLREVADYMANEDLLPEVMSGEQTVTTHTVGFGTDISDDGVALLTEAAELGGGTFTAANDYQSLKDAFQVIFREEIARNATLSSPAVTVNAFNRLAHEDSLFFTMFDPVFDSVHWPGNVKKYRLVQQDDDSYRIVDARNQPALNDNSSAIRYDALSYWTDTADPLVVANGGADGDRTELGGAASASGYHDLLYSWYGNEANKDLAHSDNAFHPTNITEEMVGLDPDDTHTDFHIWHHALGFDVDDEDGDAEINEPTRRIGAAPHGIPAVVNYGTDPATATQVIYAPTNDGFLHAIDAASGEDLWSFIPTEAMANLADIYHPPVDTYIAYGLDGSVISHEEDVAGVKKKWIFFGMRRGGRSIYALDVTDKLAPKLLWRIQGGIDEDFADLAQTWSEPRVARISVGGTPTTVLLFGGGYDAATQDSETASTGYVDDDIGNAIYIVKAADGTLLWHAAPAGNLAVPEMKSSIAAPVEIKDKNGDGLHDLVYAADVGGRVFRFDIDNTSSSGTLSIAGGMIASLGANGDANAALADNRKFFNEPDVVLVAKDGQGYWAINIGSGDRERPKSNMATQNYVFSIKDPHVFDAPPGYGYGIQRDDLYDATDNDIQDPDAAKAQAAREALLSSRGWMIALEHAGEKALAAAKTFDFRVFFTTFDPTPLDSSSCNSQPGTARLYSLDLLTAGAAAGDVNNDGTVSEEDRETILSHGTVPPPVTFMFIENPETGEIEVAPIIGRSDDEVPVDKSGVVRRIFWNIQGDDTLEP